MFLLMDTHSGFPVDYNNSDGGNKRGPFTLVQCECMLEYEHLFRPEQHTLISVFKLNLCKICPFKYLRARGCSLARAVKRFVPALIRSAQTRASDEALSEVLCLNGQIHTKNGRNARLGKYPIAGRTYRIRALDQCILLKWQHFLNINQRATTKKSLTALNWIAFVTLIKINL